MTIAERKESRDRLHLDLTDEQLGEELPPYFHPGEDSPEYTYLMERRRALDGYLPQRVVRSKTFVMPKAELIEPLLAGTGEKIQASTTTAFTRLLKILLKEPEWGARVVPIIPDEARTFGMDALFSDFKIYAPFGQQYEPVDAGLLLSYREASDGRILMEGITEAGAMASFTAAGTAYATWGHPMIPFFTFYSMFGFQRVGDLIWAFGDARGRGFLLGCTAGRTTLNGEGLQHEDGHSHLLADTVPNCRAYDPAFAYETAVIVRDGLERMLGGGGAAGSGSASKGQDVFYYLSLYNENYVMPAKPEGCEEGIVAGMYLLKPAPGERRHRAQLLGSGSILPTHVLKAQELLAADHDVAADVWSRSEERRVG